MYKHVRWSVYLKFNTSGKCFFSTIPENNRKPPSFSLFSGCIVNENCTEMIFLIGLVNITNCLRLSHWGQDVNSTFIRRLNNNLEVIWSSQFCSNQLGHRGIWKIFKYWYFSSSFAFFPRTLRHSQSLVLAAHGKDKGWQKYPTFSTFLITNSFNNKF